MYFKQSIVAVVLSSAIILSCDKNKEGDAVASKIDFIENIEGDSLKVGDIFYGKIKIVNSKDSVIIDNPQFNYYVPEAKFTPSFEDYLTHLSVGDSAHISIPADTLMKYFGQFFTADKVDSNSLVEFRIRVSDKFEEEKQALLDKEVMDKYIADSSLVPTSTETGVYVIETVQGKGPAIEQGKKVSIHYTGMLLDGRVFDSSVPRGRPFEFILGGQQVIRGWDVAIATLKKGSKATLIIPSMLGYGPMGNPPIPGRASLRFDIEILDVADAPQPEVGDNQGEIPVLE